MLRRRRLQINAVSSNFVNFESALYMKSVSMPLKSLDMEMYIWHLLSFMLIRSFYHGAKWKAYAIQYNICNLPRGIKIPRGIEVKLELQGRSAWFKVKLRILHLYIYYTKLLMLRIYITLHVGFFFFFFIFRTICVNPKKDQNVLIVERITLIFP